jgi:hypothetical protein
LRQELELFKRRLFIAKAECVDNARQLELEFAAKMRELDAMAKTLGIAQDVNGHQELTHFGHQDLTHLAAR